MSGPAILAIDGGGTKTLVALADRSGMILRLARGAGINPMDNPHWQAHYDAVLAPFREALPGIAGAVAALPAYGELAPLSRAQEEATAARLPGIACRVLNDVEAAHIGAFAGGAGVLILAGTGSMAWASDGRGRQIRVGGWGDAFGDEGSAYWIGLEAIRRASHAIDGRLDAPGFVTALFDHLGLDPADPLDALTGWHSGLAHPRSEIAALAPWIDRRADAGDPTAQAILDAAADHLAAHVAAALKRIGTAEAPPWSFAGGVFCSHRLLDALTRKIGTAPRPPILPPIGGALLRAAHDLDWPVDEAWIGRLAGSIEKTRSAREMAATTRNGNLR